LSMAFPHLASAASPRPCGERPTSAERCEASSGARRVRGLSTSPALTASPRLPLCAHSGKSEAFRARFPPFYLSQNRKKRPPHPFQSGSALVHTARTRRPHGPRVAFSGSLLERKGSARLPR